MDETAKRRNGEPARKPVRHFRDLDVCQNALAAGLRAYELSKRFLPEERYALTDQVRQSSRSVCANIAEAWRKRRYKAAFVAKLSDSDTEATETQVSAEIAMRCRYWDQKTFTEIDQLYEKVLGQIVKMAEQREK